MEQLKTPVEQKLSDQQIFLNNKELVNQYLVYSEEVLHNRPNTVDARRIDLNKLISLFRDKDIRFLTLSDIEEYLKYHKEKQIWKTAYTFKRNIDSIKIFYKWLLSHNHIKQNPAEGLKYPRVSAGSVSYITEDQLKLLYKSADRPITPLRSRLIFYLILDTGLRSGEVCSIKKDENLNLKDRLIFIPETKTGRGKLVQYSKKTGELLNQYLIQERVYSNVYLFHKENGEQTDRRIVYNAVNEIIALAYPNQKDWKKHKGGHILRHTFATRCIEDGGDVIGLQYVMGWSSLNQVNRYVHQSKRLVKEFYSRVNTNREKRLKEEQ